MRHTARRTLSAFLIVGLTLAIAGPAYAAPANEGVAGAEVIRTLPFTDTVETTDTAGAPEATSAFCTDLLHTVWYSVTATEDGFLRADTGGSDFDTVIVAYADTAGGLVEVGCDDDEGPVAPDSQLTFAVTAGTTYLIQVGGTSQAPTGSLVFHLQESGPPFGIGGITIDRAIVRRRGSVVSVTGTIECLGTPEDVTVDVSLVERTGSRTVTGEGTVTIEECRGTTTFTAEVTATNGRFVPGRASVGVTATSQTDTFVTSTTIRLRRRAS